MAAITRHKLAYIALTVLIFLAAFSHTAGAEDVVVDKVAVNVKSSDTPPPARVLNRMEASVSTVGEQVMVGRKLSDIQDNKLSYEKLIREVFDRVLVGYSVQEVEITPGQETGINVVISPWGDVVRNVRLDVDYGDLSPEMAALVKADMGNIEEQIDSVLVGLPVDSMDWAGGITKSLVREYLADQLPEFSVNVDVTAGQSTVVKLTLTPAGPTVQDIRVTLRSKSIPNILLLEARPTVEEEAAIFRGLPVAYLQRHSDYFCQDLVAKVAERPIVKRYGLSLSFSFNAGIETDVFVNVETDKYKVTLEGYLDMGRIENNTSALLHVGKYVDHKNELFMETTFIPGSVSWLVEPGWGYQLTPATETGVRYELNNRENILWLKQDLGHNWSLRLERMPGMGYNEMGIRYKIHDFLSAEYVFTSKDKWLRLVGNL